MVSGVLNNFLRKFKLKKQTKKLDEVIYTPSKSAHHWQRRKRQEEKLDKKKLEQVTQSKIDPWFCLCADPHDQKAIASFTFFGDIQDKELEAEKGDLLKIETVDRSEVWWQAISMRTNKSGFIPRNYIIEGTGIADVIDAWHDIDRRESEAKLSMPELPNGTYLLRPSSNPLRIALSVLCTVNNAKTIKHFAVKYDRVTNAYSISSTKVFAKLKDLTDYYKASNKATGLLLSSSVPRVSPAIQSRRLRIPSEKVELKTHISRGGRFGSVYKAVCTASTEREVVAKKISGQLNNDEVVARAETCLRLHNRAIVHFLGYCEAAKSRAALIIWEFMPNGSLRDYLIKKKTTIDSPRLYHWLHQILDGMEYLERVESFHGELNTYNVFLSFELCAKIGNFGFNGRFFKPGAYNPDLVETEAVRWAAPESLDPSHVYDISCDVWSFGVLMFEVFTFGSTPYKGISLKEIVKRVKTGYQLPSPNTLGFHCDDVMYGTMKNCWSAESIDRPTFRELWFVFQDYLTKDDDVYAEINILLPF